MHGRIERLEFKAIGKINLLSYNNIGKNVGVAISTLRYLDKASAVV